MPSECKGSCASRGCPFLSLTLTLTLSLSLSLSLFLSLSLSLTHTHTLLPRAHLSDAQRGSLTAPLFPAQFELQSLLFVKEGLRVYLWRNA